MNILTAIKGLFTKSAASVFLPMSFGKDYPLGNAKEFMQAYNRWPYAAISAIAEDVATIEFQLYKEMQSGELAEIPNHEFLETLKYPNLEQSQYDFIESIQSYLEIIGEAYAFGFRDNGGRGKIREFYIARPDFVTIVYNKDNKKNEGVGNTLPSKDGSVIKGFIVNAPGEEAVFFERRDVLYFHYFDPLRPHRGKGTMQAAALSIDNDDYAGKWQNSFFKNSANPGAILEFPGNMTDDQVEKLKQQFREKFQGHSKAGEPIVLHGGLKYSKMGLTQSEMEFTQSRQAMRDEILGIFRTPKTAVGITDDVNRANAEATDYVFARRIVKPRMRRIVETLNKFLRQEYINERLVLKFKDPVPEDLSAKGEYLKNATGVPYMTPNEAREQSGLESMGAEGDKVYLPFNVAPVEVSKAVKQTPEVEKKAAPKIELKVDDQLKLSMHVDRSLKSLKEKKEEDKKRQKLADQYDREFTAESKKLKRHIVEMFVKQEKRIIDALKATDKHIKRDLTVEIFKEEKEVKLFIDAMTPVLAEMVERYGQQALDQIGAGQDFVASDVVKEFIKNKALKFAKEVNETTKEALRKELTAGLSEGESIPELAKRIQEKVFVGAKTWRAEMIAQTETVAATNYGNLAGYKQSGVVTEKEWLTVGDTAVRAHHLAADGQVVGLNEEFRVNGEKLTHPGDPKGSPGNIINCRCRAIPKL